MPWRLWFSILVFALVQRICEADEGRPRALAAPTGFNAIDVGNGEMKDFLKIPGGYRDGQQRAIFEEVGPANVPASPDFPINDKFGAYDDNNVINSNAEEPLFIPLPYRNETAEEKTERERKEQIEKNSKRGKLRPISPQTAPSVQPPTRTIISNAFNGQQVTIRPTIPPSPPRSQQSNFNPAAPIQPNIPQTVSRPVQQPPFVPQPAIPRPTFVAPQQPPPQPSPPNSFQPPFVPNQPQTRPPFVPQTRPNTFVQPQRPPVGFTPTPPRQPQFNSVPPQTTLRPPQQNFNQQTSTFAPVRTTQTQPRPPVPQPGFQSFRPPVQQPATTTLSPFSQQQQFRQLRPFRPANNVAQPSTFAPPTPTRPTSNLRTGTCARTIYYKAQEATPAEIQQPFSHFAVVVSVDQCARTCHEFNCVQAIFDPTNRHCQFNPSTAFSAPQVCEQWPNPVYRNNLPITSRAIAIKCVTCQARRRTSLRPFQRQNKALGISQVQFGPLGRSTLARRIHGVIINENFSQKMTMDTDKILNKQLDAARAVDSGPSIKTTIVEHLEPLRSSSAASSAVDETKKLDENKNDDKGAEKKSLEIEEQKIDSKPPTKPEIKGEESGRPFKQNAAIVVHKLHPIHSIVTARI